jgi:N-acetyl-beta-hexosaminidase
LRLRSFNLRRVCLLLAATMAAAVALALPGLAFAGPTIVTLSFDDGWDSQQTAFTMMSAHGLRGTFYVNSGTLGQAGYLTWSQLSTLDAAGNEIGGHTLTHPDLTTLTAAQAQTEICQDRTNIQSHGFVVPDFAYPFGAYDSNTGSGTLDVSSIVRGCGYSSGRGAFGLHNITSTTDTRPYATTIPPPNLYKMLVPCCINHASFGGASPTAAALKSYVQHAETAGGGWVHFFFHRICDNCGDDSPAASISPSEFNSFLDWLAPSSSGATVKTVAQVIKNDTQAPTTSITCGGGACSSGWYGGPLTVALSATDSGSGVFATHYTTDSSEPTVASPTYTGPFTVAATTTLKFRSWDKASNVEPTKTQTIQVDTAGPTSSITCNGSACPANSWFNATVSVALSATDAQSGVASIHYTTDGSDPTLSSPAYTGPLTLSSTTTVKYRAWDTAGNAEATNSQSIQIETVAPTSSITCEGGACSSGWYTSSVSVALSATDSGGSGVASIHYTTDGSDPTLSSPTYSVPFTVSSATTVKFRGWDNAGNVEPTNAQLIQVDTTAPTSSIACNGSTCSSSVYSSDVTVTLSATDSQSGVSVIRYTLDGTDPTASSTAYSGPFGVSETTTVKFHAWDNAGNVEPTNSQLITVIKVAPDTTPPVSSITCGGGACSSAWYTSSVSVALSATDSGGSGVASIHYTTDGSDPTLSSPTYGAPFSVTGTTTVKFRAWDNAGNVEATNTQLIEVDTTAPTSSIACNGAACSGWYAPGVTVTLSASDSDSGVDSIHYTTDGSDPTISSPTYSAPFTVSSATTIKYRAWDTAGNAESTNTQPIQVDTSAPASSIACNGSTCSSSAYSSAVTVTLSATDSQSGVSVIRYTLDGTDPTASSTAYSGPFSVSETTTVKFRAWDNAGNVEPTNSRLITVTTVAPDTTPPVSSIACNLAVCSSGWYNAAVSVSLSASDGGSGVGSTHYTTDGTDPTLSSPTYTAPFSVSTTTTVKFRSWDNAGNIEPTNTQLIRIDTTAPTTSIRCNGSACPTWLNASATISLSSTDTQSGVASIHYTTDGSTPTLSSPTYTAPFTLSATTTVKYRAWDNAGNVEATKTQLIQIDTVAPAVAITSPVNGGAVTGTIKINATASDSSGGSGVAQVSFYVDGQLIGTATTPSKGIYSVTWNTKKVTNGQHSLTAVAKDVAGNSQTSAGILVTVG